MSLFSLSGRMPRTVPHAQKVFQTGVLGSKTPLYDIRKFQCELKHVANLMSYEVNTVSDHVTAM